MAEVRAAARPRCGRVGRPNRGRGRTGMRNRPPWPSRSRIRSTGPAGLPGVPTSRESVSGRTPPTRSRFKPCGIAIEPASARHWLASSPRAIGRSGSSAPRASPDPLSDSVRCGVNRGGESSHRSTTDSGSQSRTAPTVVPTRTAQRTVTIGPSPDGSNGSGPTRSSVRSPGPSHRSEPPGRGPYRGRMSQGRPARS